MHAPLEDHPAALGEAEEPVAERCWQLDSTKQVKVAIQRVVKKPQKKGENPTWFRRWPRLWVPIKTQVNSAKKAEAIATNVRGMRSGSHA
mmetsp:Transcript_5877/g.10765  ORF Transcript_5877/g.10765 Transcript_5877/m.10765 type:complete len:90 (-) Transcript_5877:198-467(-)